MRVLNFAITTTKAVTLQCFKIRMAVVNCESNGY